MFTDSLSLRLPKTLAIEEKRRYVRQVVAYANYFKGFKKTLIYRIFCCMDEGNLVILFNGFQKKTQKTPSNEIKRAKRIMDEYFQQKQDERRI